MTAVTPAEVPDEILAAVDATIVAFIAQSALVEQIEQQAREAKDIAQRDYEAGLRLYRAFRLLQGADLTNRVVVDRVEDDYLTMIEKVRDGSQG